MRGRWRPARSAWPGSPGWTGTGAETVHGGADGRDEQAAVRREIMLVDGREVAVQQHDDRVHVRLDGRSWRDGHGAAGRPVIRDGRAGTAALAGPWLPGPLALLVCPACTARGYRGGCPVAAGRSPAAKGPRSTCGHGVALCAVLVGLRSWIHAYQPRMGWSFPWASALRQRLQLDFGVAPTEEWKRGGRGVQLRPGGPAAGGRQAESAARFAVDRRHGLGDLPREGGHERFAREDGTVYHTYSTYARGLDILSGQVIRLVRDGWRPEPGAEGAGHEGPGAPERADDPAAGRLMDGWAVDGGWARHVGLLRAGGVGAPRYS